MTTPIREPRVRRNHAAAAIASAAAVWVAVFASSLARLGAHPTTDVSWNHDIARILQDRCAVCHHQGGAGSIDLTDYTQARQWAHAIKRSVLDRRMPPWRPSPGFGDFVNDRRLSSYEVELIAAWVNGGTRVGPPEPARPGAPAASSLPGAVELTSALASFAGAGRTLQLAPADHERWISGWEFRSNDTSGIKDATISLGSAVIATWSPGEPATVLPDGTAYRVPAGVTVRATLRYRDVEPRVIDTTRFAVQLSARRPQREIAQLRLVPGANTLAEAIDVLSVRPVVTSSGTSVQIIAQQPDGAVEPLLVIDRDEVDSAVTYRYRRPLRLPARTVVRLTAFDRAARATLDYVAAR